jgi:hypothetical protein
VRAHGQMLHVLSFQQGPCHQTQAMV